jgi:hypothetical protein
MLQIFLFWDQFILYEISVILPRGKYFIIFTHFPIPLAVVCNSCSKATRELK